MDRVALAACLAAADSTERSALLASHAALADAALAWALKDLYFESSASDPIQAAGAATALAALSQLPQLSDDDQVRALEAWTAGLVALQLEGQMERALERLDQAATQFQRL